MLCTGTIQRHLTLRKEHRLRAIKIRELRRMSAHKRKEVMRVQTSAS
jgi:hypothetical protein